MALGTNRDYKTADRRARKNLNRHFELMTKIMELGYAKLQASALALQIMEGKSTLADIEAEVQKQK